VLVQAIATAFMSYDQSSDADVRPDWAVKIMEDLAHTLSQLSDDDRKQFRADLEALAADLSADPFYDPTVERPDIGASARFAACE